MDLSANLEITTKFSFSFWTSQVGLKTSENIFAWLYLKTIEYRYWYKMPTITWLVSWQILSHRFCIFINNHSGHISYILQVLFFKGSAHTSLERVISCPSLLQVQYPRQDSAQTGVSLLPFLTSTDQFQWRTRCLSFLTHTVLYLRMFKNCQPHRRQENVQSLKLARKAYKDLFLRYAPWYSEPDKNIY